LRLRSTSLSRIQSKPWLVLLLLAWGIFGAMRGLDSYRHRFVRSDSEMFAFLPQGDETRFYVNAEALRRAGVLGLLAGAGRAEEADYRVFLRETHFDYTRDIRAVAGAAGGAQILLIVRGQFDWSRLRAYAAAHGGSCAGELCYAPTSKAGRWASFYPIQPDVMALAVSPNRSAAQALRGSKGAAGQFSTVQPVWVELSQSVLKDPGSLPLALRIFVMALESADSVILSLKPAEGADAQFQLELNARCATAAAAQAMRNQLEIDTKMLKLALVREHAPAGPADLTGLLTAGTFYVVDDHVTGRWPIRKELLKALE
jgi:hypothetical protein